MLVKFIGVVSGVSSYEKDGKIIGRVAVACGENAFNITTADYEAYLFGDCVTVIGDWVHMKTGSYLKDGRVCVASQSDRDELMPPRGTRVIRSDADQEVDVFGDE